MKFNIPKSWTEKDCNINVKTLIEKSLSDLNGDKVKYDEVAKQLMSAAYIVKHIPELKRKSIKTKTFKKKTEQQDNNIKNTIVLPNNDSPFNVGE